MKPIHVALSGSGFKFPAHVGALLAIRDAGYEIKEIAGTSGGSIIACLVASGMDLETMKALTLDTDWSDMLTFSPLSLFRDGYCSGEVLLDWISENTGHKTFSELPIDLVIIASNITLETEFEFNRATSPDVKIAFAARASASIPFVYAHVEHNDYTLMDGGMCNNIAVDKLTHVSGVQKLGIQLVSKTVPASGTDLLTDIEHIVRLMLTSNEHTHVALGRSKGCQVVFVETGYANSLDCNMDRSIREQLLKDGYDSTAATLLTLK